LTEKADQLDTVDFASLALSVFSDKIEEIIPPDLPLQEDFERRILFLGEWNGQEDRFEFLNTPEQILKDGQFESLIFSQLKNGRSLLLDLSELDDARAAAIIYDAFYGLMLSDSFKNRVSDYGLDVGKLEIVIPESCDLFEIISFIGEVLLASILPLIEQKFLGPSKVFSKLYGILKEEVSFFIPLSNLFISKLTDEGIEKYDSLLNYDNHWGGLLGWYRLEYALRLVDPNFRFSFPEEVRKELDEIVMDKIIKVIWLHRAIEDLLNDKGNQTFKDVIEFHLEFYEVDVAFEEG
jgi:hypothetical protein